MTDRQRILTTIRGEPPDRLPWVPRLDFWYRGRSRQGTLPPELRGLSLMEITGRLGVGCYATIPDYTACADELDMLDYGLGIYRLPALLFEPVLEGVERRVTRRARETVVEYRTPVGSVRTATVFTDEMLDAGASVPWRTEHAVREPRDLEVIGYIFSHVRVEPRLERYERLRAEVGERGVMVGWAGGSACPIHHILRELMTVDEFFYAMHDCPEAVLRAAEQMEPYYRQVRETVASSAAEIVLLGGNYDDSITSPPFFEKHILPALRSYAETLHRTGKFLMTHTDGENRRLLPLYRAAQIDIADSVCPYPMTRSTLDELVEALMDRVTIWGGIPSVLLCADSTPEADFRRFIDGLLARWGRRPRLVLGVSDMVTVDAEFDRLRYITDAVARL